MRGQSPEAGEKTAPKLPVAPQEIDPGRVSALGLAYVGDTIFDLLVRTRLLAESNAPVNTLNRRATALVNARSQSKMVEALEPLFTEEEAAVYRRGRNAKSATHAKNAGIVEYRRATGLEAVFGYLYLSGAHDRMEELFCTAVAVMHVPDNTAKRR